MPPQVVEDVLHPASDTNYYYLSFPFLLIPLLLLSLCVLSSLLLTHLFIGAQRMRGTKSQEEDSGDFLRPTPKKRVFTVANCRQLQLEQQQKHRQYVGGNTDADKCGLTAGSAESFQPFQSGGKFSNVSSKQQTMGIH